MRRSELEAEERNRPGITAGNGNSTGTGTPYRNRHGANNRIDMAFGAYSVTRANNVESMSKSNTQAKKASSVPNSLQ